MQQTGIAVILAAGAGRKFLPYNTVRNKCAFPIGNTPVVARLVLQLREIGFSRIVVVVGYEEASVRAALRPHLDSNIVFVRQASGAMGTVPATLSALQSIGVTSESLLVAYGDVIVSTEDIRAVWQLHTQHHATASFLCAPVGDSLAQDWIGCQIKRERPKGGALPDSLQGHSTDSTFRMGGIFAFGAEALPYVQNAPATMTHVPVGGMPPVESDLAEVYANLLDEGKDVAAVVAKHPTADLDKCWNIFDASNLVLQEQANLCTESRIHPTAKIADSAEITGNIIVEEGAVIGSRAVLKGFTSVGRNTQVINGAIVGEGVLIGAETRISDYCLVSGRSVIGNHCVVGHGGEMDGIMLDHSYIWHYSEIFGVLGLSVDIGAATVCGTLRFDDGNTIHRLHGRRELPRLGSNATYFGDYCRTGVNVITQPGAKIGTYSCVGAGVVLYDDVPDRKLILLKQETIVRDWGPERYGW